MIVRPYLVVFNAFVGQAQLVQDALDKVPEVTHWFRCFPDAIFVTSRLSAHDLSERLRSLLGIAGVTDKRLFVTQIHPLEAQGWLPAEAWHLINNPATPVLPKK